MTQRDLAAWLSYLEQLDPNRIDYGLEKIQAVDALMALCQFSVPVITVAGTNGKGSSVALLEAAYQQQGYRTACYTSPHILHFNERLRIAGKPIDELQLAQAFNEVDARRNNVLLSYFEFTTLAMFYLINQAQPDVVILEVGMGGRLDTVNLVDADVALITNIDLDHQAWLGNTREAIGREKAGIMRAQRPCVCGDQQVPQSVLHTAQTLGAVLYLTARDFAVHTQDDGTWLWQGPTGMTISFSPCPLGQENAANVCMVVQLLQQRLPVSRENLRRALSGLRLAGRCQIISQDPLVIVDVAHNPAAAHFLRQKLQHYPCSGKTLAVVAMLADKAICETVAALMPCVDVWYFAGLEEVPRGASVTQTMEAVANLDLYSAYQAPCLETVFAKALASANSNDRVIVFGSFYTVMRIMRYTDSTLEMS